MINKSNVSTWESKIAIVKHSRTQNHLDQAQVMNSQPKLTFAGQSSDKVLYSGLQQNEKMAIVAAASNIILAFYDKLSPTIRNIFPDSKLGSNYVPLSINKSYLHVHAEWCYSTNTEE